MGTPQTIEHANAIERIGYERGHDAGYEKGFLAGSRSREGEVQESRKWKRFIAALVRRSENGKLEIRREELRPQELTPSLTVDHDDESDPGNDFFVRGECYIVRIAE